MDTTLPAYAYREGDTPLVVMFRHHLWANLGLLQLCAGLSDEQLAAEVIGGYGSLYETLGHIVRSDQVYLIHLTGREPARRLRRGERLTLEEMMAQVALSGAGLIDVAATARADDTIVARFDDGSWSMPASVVLTQAINHATEHRAQAMAIVTQLGVEPLELSGWVYAEAFMPNELVA